MIWSRTATCCCAREIRRDVIAGSDGKPGDFNLSGKKLSGVSKDEVLIESIA
jgi:hypothetical protein